MNAAIIEIIEPETGKIGYQDVLWQFVILQTGEIVKRLPVGFIEIFAPRFMFDQDHPFPEQVNVSTLKNSSQNVLASASSPETSSQSFENRMARSLISFYSTFANQANVLIIDTQRPDDLILKRSVKTINWQVERLCHFNKRMFDFLPGFVFNKLYCQLMPQTEE